MFIIKTRDMTHGNPIKPILFFTLPVMAGNVVQQLHTVVDSMVVGNLVGINAFAAVGATGFLFTLFLGLLSAFSQGTGIIFAQRFGAKDEAGMRRAIAAAIRLSLVFGIFLTLLGTFFARPLLTLMRTPSEIFELSATYIGILFAGTLINLFNYLSSTLSFALGDSKTPLWATVISSAVNIVLDLFFVIVFDMGVAGVAIATVIAWLSSFLFCLFRLKRLPILKLKRADFKRDKAAERDMLRLSAPITFRDLVINCGGLIIQAFVNGYGVLFVAGVSTAQKFFGILQMAGAANDVAYSTYVAQNFGSHNMKRIKRGLFASLKISFCGAAIISAIFIVFGHFLLSLLISGDPTEIAVVLDIAYKNLIATIAGIPFLLLLYLFRSGIQGMGRTLIPTISGFLELFARLFGVAVLPLFIGTWGIHISSGLGWLCAATLLFFGFIYYFRLEEAKDADKAK